VGLILNGGKGGVYYD